MTTQPILELKEDLIGTVIRFAHVSAAGKGSSTGEYIVSGTLEAIFWEVSSPMPVGVQVSGMLIDTFDGSTFDTAPAKPNYPIRPI